jgi:hypothetical protein
MVSEAPQSDSSSLYVSVQLEIRASQSTMRMIASISTAMTEFNAVVIGRVFRCAHRAGC